METIKKQTHYNPFSTGMKHYDLDGESGIIRVVHDGSTAVIYLETEGGYRVVLNIVDYNE